VHRKIDRLWIGGAWLLLAAAFLGGCAPARAVQAGIAQITAAIPGAAGRQVLTVNAAASLTEAFTEIAAQFERAHPDAQVILNLAGSQQLAQQIAQGAPADVFASADLWQMQAAVDSGRIDPSRVQVFAANRLVVVFPSDNPANIQSLHDLANPGVKLGLAAEAVPAGAYALEFLGKASQDPSYGSAYRQGVLDNVVSFENSIRAVLSKAQLGEIDAGIVYASDFTSARNEQLGAVEIPPELNITASYYLAPVTGSARPKLAEAFIRFVHSPEGQAVLARYGLLPPG